MKLIVGVDPGMTTAIAVVDIESEFYHTHSRRDFSFSEMCDYLVSLGEPIMVSVDTVRIPEAVKRVAAAFNAKLHCPKRDLYVGEKKSIIGQRGVKNDHERDALAAALHAKSSFSAFFGKVDRALEERSLSYMSVSVKELLLKSEAGNIEQAVKMLTPDEPHGVKLLPRVIETKKIIELRRGVERLEKEKAAMKKKVEALENENRQLRQPVPINEPSIVRNLRREVSSLAAEKQRIREEYELFKALSSSHEIVAQPGEDVKNRLVLFGKGMSAKEMERQGAKAIISDMFIDTHLPVIRQEKIRLEKAGRFLVADRSLVESALKESFIEWVSQYKELRKHEAEKA